MRTMVMTITIAVVGVTFMVTAFIVGSSPSLLPLRIRA